MIRQLALIVGLVAIVSPLTASTLLRLTLDEMVDKSTQIVRGRVVGSRTAMRGPVVYTLARIEVAERWKGSGASQVEVAIPGGAHGRVNQTFSGAPQFAPDGDYVLFLWTGKSGVTQVIGLSQGVFKVKTNAEGLQVVERPASQAMVLDASGKPVADKAVSYLLDELRRRVTGR